MKWIILETPSVAKQSISFGALSNEDGHNSNAHGIRNDGGYPKGLKVPETKGHIYLQVSNARRGISFNCPVS